MRGLIRRILKEESDKQTDLANTQSSDYNICDDFSAESYEDLVQLINKAHVSKEDHSKIMSLLDELEDSMNDLSSDKDLINTYQHKISTLLCR